MKRIFLLITFSFAFCLINPLAFSKENKPASNRSWVSDSIFFPQIGDVKADLVCLNLTSQKFQYERASYVINKCLEGYYDYTTNYREPNYICTNSKMLSIPAKTFFSEKVYQQNICSQYDYSDSKSPVCLNYETITKNQITSYRIYTCFSWDYRCENPTFTTEKIRICQDL